MTSTLALLLADGRFPSGGHAHSSGWEAAAAQRSMVGAVDVFEFVAARLDSTGVQDAAFIAHVMAMMAAESTDGEIARIDAEYEARTTSPAQRQASRAQGRQWVRAAAGVHDPDRWLHDLLTLIERPHLPIGFAAVAHAWTIDTATAVQLHLHHLVTGIGTAAVRLHGLDPGLPARLLLRLADPIEDIVLTSARWSSSPVEDLPSRSSPLLDVLAEHHQTWDMRLFQS